MKPEQKGGTHGFQQQSRALQFFQLFGFLVLTTLPEIFMLKLNPKVSFSKSVALPIRLNVVPY